MSKHKHHSKHHSNHHDHSDLNVVHKDCGYGMHAKVSIVKRKSDGKLIIWKRPISNDHEHREALKKEIKRAKYWRKFGISKVKVCQHADKISLLKTYVKGKTLRQILEKDRHFFSEEKSRPLRELGKFLRTLIDSRHYIQNLSCENLVYDGKKWHVIDSSNVHKKESRSKIKRDYKRKYLGIWSKMIHSDNEIKSLKLFLKKYCC